MSNGSSAFVCLMPEDDDLALAVSGRLVGAGEAAQDRERSGEVVTLAHDVLILLEDSHLHGQVKQRLPLVVLGRKDALQPADERMVVGC